MLLYLLRHADAENHVTSDAARKLTHKGHEQAAKVADFCRKNGFELPAILSSPLVRAHQTAQAVADRVGTKLEIVPWLACGLTPETALEELKPYRDKAGVMIVGHEPDFSSLVAWLLGLPTPMQLSVRKASLTLLEVMSWRAGAARLDFSLPCRLM
jgi:phosphohistidine phosphatase